MHQAHAIVALEQQLRAYADRLRETAEELKAGTIHPNHAANRIAKIANQIAKEEK